MLCDQYGRPKTLTVVSLSPDTATAVGTATVNVIMRCEVIASPLNTDYTRHRHAVWSKRSTPESRKLVLSLKRACGTTRYAPV
eukprot:1355105-Prymnesium_polylepis.1